MSEFASDVRTVLIPAGAFVMGDNEGRPDERPAHRVMVSAFRMAALPVSNKEYGRFLHAAGREAPRFWEDARFNDPLQPVVGVAWDDAAAYCEWLSEPGWRFRLPTEAEWEKAAAGGVDGVKYPWGDESFDGSGGRFEMEATWRIGAAPANPYGVIDIGFNQHEWCSDWYDAGYYAVSPETDPRGPATGKRRSSRGGAWRHLVKVSRCAARSSLPPEFRYNDYGFRVAEEISSTR